MSETDTRVSHPGLILKASFMDPLGISINRLARLIHVPPNRISAIVNGKRAITADTALRLERFFGIAAKNWMHLQADYDLDVERRESWLKIAASITPGNKKA
ncbi:HigA family addiction module antitoxin [Oceanibacterium hippocampi]|uniref:Putative HTH-type transcriptional regulator YbaQ n=1 Tax=Oceanibacterium hippocampi TaxID=745714 RepID=A0A1Y5RZD5_9PROT|nr:HigA family addiction module antitoxin [Oceanibacterium hippocampi]SLN29135.1 putative HTH-type transcriptional regulator YbaQ [Oceanibacterium hippocampi]